MGEAREELDRLSAELDAEREANRRFPCSICNESVRISELAIDGHGHRLDVCVPCGEQFNLVALTPKVDPWEEMIAGRLDEMFTLTDSETWHRRLHELEHLSPEAAKLYRGTLHYAASNLRFEASQVKGLVGYVLRHYIERGLARIRRQNFGALRRAWRKGAE